MTAPAAKLTVAEHLSAWLESKLDGQHIRLSTYRSYESYIRCHIIPSLGAVKVAALTPIAIQRFLDQKAQEGLSRRSLEYLRAILRASFGRRDRAKLIIADAVVPKNARRAPAKVRIGKVEINAILAAVHGTNLYPLVLTAAYTGLRQGELLGLQWQDVEPATGQLAIRHQLQHGELVELKTEKSVRTLPMVPEVREIFEVLRADRVAEGRISPWVFASRTGGPLDGMSLTHRFQKALQRAGLPHYRWHDLRVACGTLLLENGVDIVDIKVVSTILGHSQISPTQNVYQSVTDRLKLQAFSTLAAK